MKTTWEVGEDGDDYKVTIMNWMALLKRKQIYNE